jgi:hypothetical protein
VAVVAVAEEEEEDDEEEEEDDEEDVEERVGDSWDIERADISNRIPLRRDGAPERGTERSNGAKSVASRESELNNNRRSYR